MIKMARPMSKSLYDWCIENDRQDILELWDYTSNKVSPKDVAYSSNKKYYFKCPRGIHSSELKCINNLTTRASISKCKQCNSIGQYLIDFYGSLENIWDFSLNTTNPFEIQKSSRQKIWIFCLEKRHHGSYEIRCDHFYNGARCPLCCNYHGRVHPKDSFAQYHIDNTDTNFLEKHWSKKNEINPFLISPYSSKRGWFICQNNKKHEDYETVLFSFTYGTRCPKCNESHGERKISEWLNSKDIKYIKEKTFSNLFGIGNEPLRYDFHLLEHNLLIEYQGEYHDGTVKYTNETQEEYEKRFLKQQEHDRRKREYAEQNGIRLLEIWYWDYDNIETILNKNI